MCGIVGFASAYTNGFTRDEMIAFTEMLYIDTFRGWDSTGVFSVHLNGNVNIAKKAVAGGEFIQHKEYKDWINQAVSNGMFVVGHNRAATRGEIKDENAHPFWVDDKIILVQNGTMYGDHKKHADVEVDSEAIAHILSKEDDIATALGQFHAAYALVWYNTETKKLHLIRNSARPLWIAKLKSGAVLWASEPETILYGAGHNKFAIEDMPKQIPEHTLITFDLGSRGNKWVRKEEPCLPKFKSETSQSSNMGPWVENEYGWTRSYHGQRIDHRRIASAYGCVKADDCGYADDLAAARRMASKHTNLFPHRSPKFDAHATPQVSAIEVESSFRDEAIRKYDVWFYQDQAKCNEDYLKAQELLKTSPTIIVQLQDFIPANSRADCKVWWVMGFDVTPGAPDIMYYWLMRGMTEEEVYVKACREEAYWEVEPHGPQKILFEKNGKHHGLIFGYCSTAKLVEINDNKEVKVVH